MRNIVRLYPYDVSEQGDEKSLRGSSQEVADALKTELQQKVEVAGLEVIEVRITHLAYAPEIAAAMLQRQQAAAIIEARQKIVEGAVGMVEMALNKLSENEICSLDEERKAQMVSNLLVVLCRKQGCSADSEQRFALLKIYRRDKLGREKRQRKKADSAEIVPEAVDRSGRLG